MSIPIPLDAKILATFDGSTFRALCNELIRVEAERLGIAQHLVNTTVVDSEGDRGIDARVSSPIGDSRNGDRDWIPLGTSAWQFKSGRCPSAAVLEKNEFTKPGVIEAVKRGESYCLLVAHSINVSKKMDIEKALRRLYRKCKRRYSGRVYTATQLEQWARDFLAIAVRYLHAPLAGWQIYEMWSATSRYSNAFFPDAQRNALLKEVAEAVARKEYIIRVVGHSGSGKTRTVLEALRSTGIRERVLYLADAARFDPNLTWSLRQRSTSGSAILVVDECPSEEFPTIRGFAEQLPPGFTVIALGPSGFGVGAGGLELGALDMEAMSRIIESHAPWLPEPHRRAIALRCGGSPALAVLCAKELGKNKETKTWAEIEEAHDVVEYLATKLLAVNESNPEGKLLRAVSLFTRLGWWDRAAEEGKQVAEFFSLDWSAAVMMADLLIKRGLLSRRGFSLYPRIDALANHLTRECIRAFGANHLRGLFKNLPYRAQRSFAERLRQLGESPQTQGAVDSILGESGFFRILSDLNDQAKAHFFRLLATAFPSPALHQIQRIVSTAARDDLLKFGDGRREIVSAMDELAWWTEHFDAVARVVLRLAWAENETWSNNATGLWERLFQVMLSGTSTPFDQRIPILQEALLDKDPLIRRLGVLALGAALQTNNLTRLGGPPADTGRLPQDEWKPRTYGDWRRILSWGLERLDHVLNDPDDRVRNEAINILFKRGHDLIKPGLLKSWGILVRRLALAPFEVRRPFLGEVEFRLKHQDALEADDISMLMELKETLSGSSLSDRLHRYVGEWNYERENSGEPQRIDPIKQLAEEYTANPTELNTEFPWLLSGNAHSAFAFGRRIAHADLGAMRDHLLKHWNPEVRDDSFHSGYFLGLSELRGKPWLEDYLDTLATNADKARLVASATWLVLSSDRGAKRLTSLMASGLVPRSFIGRLVAGFWARGVTPACFRDLVSEATKDKSPGCIGACLAVLDQYTHEYQESLMLFQSIIDDVLTHASSMAFGDMDVYHWAELAQRVVSGDPLRIAHLCVHHLADRESMQFEDEVRSALHETIKVGGWTVFEEVIGPAILRHPVLLWRLDNLTQGRALLAQLDPAKLIQWIKQDVAGRVGLIANAAPVHGQPLHELARQLLVHWGERGDVRSGLAATFGSGTWYGEESDWLNSKLKDLNTWSKDPDSKVRSWASELAASYEKQVHLVALHEQEERFEPDGGGDYQ